MTGTVTDRVEDLPRKMRDAGRRMREVGEAMARDITQQVNEEN